MLLLLFVFHKYIYLLDSWYPSKIFVQGLHKCLHKVIGMHYFLIYEITTYQTLFTTGLQKLN